MKKTLIILSGGRAYGNTAQLVKSFAEGAKSAGHIVETISLIQNEVKGCLGCNACRYGKPPIISGGHSPQSALSSPARYPPLPPQKDAFNSIVPSIKESDCIVFASPLYFWTISSQTGVRGLRYYLIFYLPPSKSKAFIERFYCIAIPDENPPLGRYEKYPVKNCALLMTSADNFFWTFEQAASYYQFAIVNYIGFHDKGMLLEGGCGDTNGKPQIDKTDWLQKAYTFGREIYGSENSAK